MLFNFAGKKTKTAVKPKTYTPEFNESLHLATMQPSMCDVLKLAIYDSDFPFTGDDLIGSQNVLISAISSQHPENGFLPTLGPTWICLYGQPRSYSAFNNSHFEEMNAGIIEGCAYRGRVLVEISCKPAEKIAKNGNLLPSDFERLKVLPVMKPKKFKLRVVLLNATCIHKKYEGKNVGSSSSCLSLCLSDCPSTNLPTSTAGVLRGEPRPQRRHV